MCYFIAQNRSSQKIVVDKSMRRLDIVMDKKTNLYFMFDVETGDPIFQRNEIRRYDIYLQIRDIIHKKYGKNCVG